MILFFSDSIVAMKSLLSIADIQRGSHLLREAQGSPRLDLKRLRGCLTEFSTQWGHPSMTLALDLVAQTQRAGEPVAWLGGKNSLFYPPDAARWRLDWSALALIRLETADLLLKSADKLLRSGAFGLVVLDFVGLATGDLFDGLLGRLLRLAETHESAVLFLTQRAENTPSISSLISLRAHLQWRHLQDDRLQANLTIIKDKRRGPGRRFQEVYDGPMGLR